MTLTDCPFCFTAMSEAPSESSVRILDENDGAPAAHDRRDESDGSESADDASGVEDNAEAESNASVEMLDDDQHVNGDGTRVVTPPLSPSASQAPPKVKTPKMKDGKPFCGHHKNPKDPHCEGLCEGCKIFHGIELCTLENRCECCVHLDNDEFQERVLDKREMNLRKKTARHRRNKERQLPHRSSPRFTSSMSDVVRTDIPLSPSGTTIVRLDSSAKAKLAAEAQYRPTVSVARMRFDIEAACYNELKDNQLDLDRYCNARGLHPYTLQYVRKNREFATCPLRHVSKRLESIYPLPASQQMPQVPPSLMNLMSAPSASTAPAAASVAPPPDVDANAAHRDLLDYTTDLLARAPPRQYLTREEEPEAAAKASEENLVRAILSYIAEHSPVEARAPPATSSAPTLRAGFQLRTERPAKLCLTSSQLLKDCLTLRDDEFKDQVQHHRARELGKICQLKQLSVGMASYTPGDDVFPLRPPQPSPEYSHWLPLPHKTGSVTVTMSDIELLESTARSACRVGTTLDSALTALASNFGPLEHIPMFAPLLDYVGMLVRDNMKLNVFTASTLMQLRRDYVLQNATLEPQYKLELRATPMFAADSLFPEATVDAIIEKARVRNRDTRDAGLMKLAT